MSDKFSRFEREVRDYISRCDNPDQLITDFLVVCASQFTEKIARKVEERESILKDRLINLTGLRITNLNENLKDHKAGKKVRDDIAFGLFYLAKVDADFRVALPEIETVLFGEHNEETFYENIGWKPYPVLPTSEIEHNQVVELDAHIFDYSKSDNSTKLITDFDRISPIHEGDVNVFDALHWRAKLTRIMGRDKELQSALDFVISATNKVSKFVIISGSGGSGKTRLASELAEQIETYHGWKSGFLPRSYKIGHKIDVGQTGCCIFVDYPEERTELACELIRYLLDQSDTKIPICLVLVTRESAEDWFERLNITHLRNCMEVSLSKGNSLPESVAERLCAGAISELRKLGLIFDPPKQEIVKNWLSKSSSHCLPLFSIAACLHAAIEPEKGFSLSSREILVALAKIERTRVRSYSERNLGDQRLLEKLLCFSLFVNDGLSRKILENLDLTKLVPNFTQNRLDDSLIQTPYWSSENSSLVRLEPDRAAAAFVCISFDWNSMLAFEAKWIGALMHQKDQDFFSILDRMLLDISFVSEANSELLADQILDLLSGEGKKSSLKHAMAFPARSSPYLKKIQETIFSGFDNHGKFLGRFGIGFKAKSLEAKINLGKMDGVLELSEKILGEVEEELRELKDQPLKDPTKFKDYINLVNGLTAASVGILRTGNSEKSLKVAIESVNLAERIDHSIHPRVPISVASAYLNLGQQYMDLGSYDKALSQAQRGIETCQNRKKSSDNHLLEAYARCCWLAAESKRKMEKFYDAELHLLDSKNAIDEILASGSKGIEDFQSVVLSNLLRIYVDLNKLDDLQTLTEQYFEFIMDNSELVIGKSASEAPWWVLCGASQLLEAGDLNSANKLARKAKLISDRVTSTPDWLRLSVNLWLAHNLRSAGDLMGADSSFEQAMILVSQDDAIPKPILMNCLGACCELLLLVYQSADLDVSLKYTDDVAVLCGHAIQLQSDEIISAVYNLYVQTESWAFASGQKEIFIRLCESHIGLRKLLSDENIYKHHQQYCAYVSQYSIKLFQMQEYELAYKYATQSRDEFQIVYESDRVKFSEQMETMIYNCKAIEEKLRNTSSG